jgi:hypothetical protein
MPHYVNDITEAGWIKSGKYWVHPKHPGKKYWSEVEVYHKEDWPGKRPLSVTPPEPKPVVVEVPKVEPVVSDEPKKAPKTPIKAAKVALTRA